MNILLVSGPGISLKEPYDSGIEAFIVSLANQLACEGHAVDVVAAEAADDARFGLINPFTTPDKETPNPSDLDQKQQFRNLDVETYDVIHYNMFYPRLLEAGMDFEKALVVTLHSPADEKRVAVYKKIAQDGDVLFVTVSERMKHEWDAALGIDTLLITNGINMDLWPTRNFKNRDYLLWSARITEEKNTVAAIQVAQQTRLPLKIAGRISDQHYFDANVKPHLNSQIEYVGHLTQRELSGLAKRASAYLATATWQEPFGLAALEMLASGVPVVGFRTAVPPNWVHKSVLLTDSQHWQDLVALVRKSDAISPAVCKEFASSMDIQNMTGDYIKLYSDSLVQTAASDESACLRCA